MDPPFTEEHQLFPPHPARVRGEGGSRRPRPWSGTRPGSSPARCSRGWRRSGALGINYPESVGGSGAATTGSWWCWPRSLVRARNSGLQHGRDGAVADGHAADPGSRHRGAEEGSSSFRPSPERRSAPLGISEPDAGQRRRQSEDQRGAGVGDDYVIKRARKRCGSRTAAGRISSSWRSRTGRAGLRGNLAGHLSHRREGFSASPRSCKKVGNLSSDTALLFFEDCRIPARYLLGEENEGFYHVMTNFQGRAPGGVHRSGLRHAAPGRRRAPLRERAERVRQAVGQVPGLAPPVRRAPHRHRGGALADLPRLRPLQAARKRR